MEAVPVLNLPLAESQAQALHDAGIALVDVAPHDEPYLVFSARTWFTAETLRRLCAAGPGRLLVEDPRWWEATGALQDTPRPGLYELALLPAGAPPSLQVEPVAVDLALKLQEPPPLHPKMAHGLRPLLSGPAMVHQLDHWTHIVRVNQLALLARAEAARLRWEQSGWLRRIVLVLGILWRAGALRKDRILAALSEKGQKVDIHPTAVVEMCVLGDNVQIGPHAIVRASVLGDGVKIEDHATVNLSVLGAGSTVGRYGMLNLSTLYPQAMVSHGGGFQACAFGARSFVAWGATILDLSFGRTVQVRHQGALQDSGQHFLGAAVGHDAVVGNSVRLTYGAEVPNAAMLVASAEGLIRDASEAPPGQPARWAPGGGTTPLGKKPGAG